VTSLRLMRPGTAARALAVVAALAAAAGLAACGTPPPSLTFHPVQSSAPASPGAGVSSAASPSGAGSSASGPASAPAGSRGARPAAAGSGAAQFPDARAAAMAFRGTYRAQLLVISAAGSLSQDLGAVHAYTWHVVPSCGGSCVRATSTSHAAFTLTYKDGQFEGTGGGTSHCLTKAGKAAGAGFQTTLKIALQPATSATPVTGLAGIEILTVSSGCSGNTGPGTEVIQYALTRTGALVKAEGGPGGARATGGDG
jgi:hypothetical protein